jgi:hypothetical protein
MAKDKQRPIDAKTAPRDESFLGRWSRRKAEARTPPATSPAETEAETASTEHQESITDPDQVNRPPAAAVELPDIDQMGAGSDFRVFMQPGVPPALKTKALRKLWRVKPELANLDGLLDYGEDLTGSFKVMDNLKTAYEVGRGFLRDDKSDDHKDAKPEDQDETVAEPSIAEVQTPEDGQASADDESQENVIPSSDPADKPPRA